jgi:hypothetical protein
MKSVWRVDSANRLGEWTIPFVPERKGDGLPVIADDFFDAVQGEPVTWEIGGTLTAAPVLTGAFTATVQFGGSLSAIPSLAGTLSRQCEVGGQLSATPSLTGTFVRQAAIGGTLSVTPSLGGAMWMQSEIAGNLSVTPNLSGTFLALAEFAGELVATPSLTGVFTSGSAAASHGPTVFVHPSLGRSRNQHPQIRWGARPPMVRKKLL